MWWISLHSLVQKCLWRCRASPRDPLLTNYWASPASPAVIPITYCGKGLVLSHVWSELQAHPQPENLPSNLHWLTSYQQHLGMRYMVQKKNNKLINKGKLWVYFSWATQGKGQVLKWCKNWAFSCKAISSYEISSWFIYSEPGKIKFILMHKLGN